MHTNDLPIDWYCLINSRKPYPLHKRLGLIAVILFSLAVLNWYAPARPTIAVRALASSIIVVGFYPTWRWLVGTDRGLPFAPLLGMIFPMYYAVPLFIMERYTWKSSVIPEGWLVEPLWFALAGLALMLFGYYASRGILEHVMPRARMRWCNLGHTKLLGVFFGLVGIVIYGTWARLNVSETMLPFVAYMGDLSVLGICILFILQLNGQLDRFSRMLLWCVLVPGRVLLASIAGETSYALAVPLLLIFAYASVRHAMPWKWLVVGMLGFFVIRPMMTPLRAMTWKGGPLYGESEVAKAKALTGIVKEAVKGGIPYDAMFQFGAKRLAYSIPFAIVVHETPKMVPYWNGESYAPLLYKFIPRLFYRDKPKEMAGQAFGHRYGFMAPNDHFTIFALSQTAELYCNFGVLGVIFGSFLFGLLYRAIHSVFVHPQMGFGALVGALIVLTPLFRIEWNASTVLGGVLWTFVFIGLANLALDIGELRLGARVPRPIPKGRII
ncbi:MAG: hypothetical protein ACLQU2_18865 [Candidatus Binataceae bacterium]